MAKFKIRLDTMSDVNKLVSVTSQCDCDVFLTDGKGFRVSAKSILGALYTMEWNEVFLESEVDLYNALSDLVIIE